MTQRALALAGVRCLAVVLLLGSLRAPAVHAQGSPATPAEWQFTPLIEGVVSPPRWFAGTDGRIHLVYELLLTNALTVPATISAVAVLDADSGATLQRLNGAALRSAMSLVTSPDTPDVVLDLRDGRFAAYAHLHAGSVTVRPGDRVRRGQTIAKAGSSGTTGGPHVHFQVMDRPSILFADGMPYMFDAFTLTGQTPPLATVLPYYDSLEPIPMDTRNAGPRRDAFPMSRDVVTFPSYP